MSDRPKLFISHASKEDALARRVITELRQRVGDTFDVLLDEVVLEGGDRWRNELWNWWSDCDAAVVVCSEEALKSRWVLIETSVLMRRKSVNPNFPVLPLIVDPVTPGTVKTGLFHDQQLAEQQAMTFKAATFDQTLIDLATKLAAFRALDRTNKPFVTWEDRLAAVLEKTNSAEVLRDVATSLGVTADTWTGLPLQARIVARALLEHGDRTKIIAAIRSLRPRLDAPYVKEIVDLVAPAWLAAEDVAPVSAVIDRPLGSRGVALASWGKRMAEWYVQRAACRYPLARPIPFKAPRASDDVGEVVANIAAGIRDYLFLDDDTDNEVIQRRLKKKDTDRDPVFALIPVTTKPNPSPRLDAELLAEVMEAVNDQFRTIGFFILAGQPPVEVEVRTNGKVILVPHDVEKEKSLSEDYSAALD